ncbi:ABC transporter permease [Streptomyces sp. NPDC051940]|uniref:ABC transporter permease n=1 Tax=Streptomyces sp. NPDC051940 TaxID=3155675 RepID=UPI003446902D
MPHDSALRLGALVRLNTALLLRESGPLASRLVMPLVLLTLLRPLYQAAQGDEAGNEQAVVGVLVMFSLLAMSLVGTAVLTERVWHTWERLRVTAARPAELLAGKAVPVLVALLAQQGLVLGYGVWLLDLRLDAPALLGVACLAWTLALLAMGAALGAVARSFGELSAAYDIGGMLLSALGGALVPLSQLPHWVGTVAPLSPGYWGFGALRGALHGDAGAVFTDAAALLGFAVAAALAAAYAVGRGRARSDRL